MFHKNVQWTVTINFSDLEKDVTVFDADWLSGYRAWRFAKGWSKQPGVFDVVVEKKITKKYLH